MSEIQNDIFLHSKRLCCFSLDAEPFKWSELKQIINKREESLRNHLLNRDEHLKNTPGFFAAVSGEKKNMSNNKTFHLQLKWKTTTFQSGFRKMSGVKCMEEFK